ncbi:MAG TPA: aldehyde dehydrogenase (NADP(+)) [Candidatus Angelobacter sp.]|nr:aldehyde dehydrogenase (NADP(+)) [Candidatus Angelobacter sp.]
MNLLGRSIVGASDAPLNGTVFHAFNPVDGARLEPAFSAATPQESDSAVRLAADAFSAFSRIPGRERAVLLRSIAAGLERNAENLVSRAMLETALPKARLEGEVLRTSNQLKLFAEVLEEGSWVGARIDRADPNRKPAPKPDIRSMLRPLGPVVVFGASNFPLAFSVAGGDTASALAAGNPVIVKAHPAHPGVSELAARVIQQSVRECGLPEGVFSLLFDNGTQAGVALVRHSLVKAVGFTGSHAAGRALMDIAASRPDPIPFFGELGSTNPVFILPGALRERWEALASGLHGSFTLGAGQFCTKPGMVFVPEAPQAGSFAAELRRLTSASPQFHLLTAGIRKAYSSATAQRAAHQGIQSKAEYTVAHPKETQERQNGDGHDRGNDEQGFSVQAMFFETDIETFLKNSDFAAEVFGPATLLVHRASGKAALEIAEKLEGHLTATIHGTEEDLKENAALVAALEAKAGRLIFNGFPTGVEVCHAMVHGGPYPATTDGRSTSVGSQAIFRFTRPVCYQGFPEQSLPPELQDTNPLSILRMIDGKTTREAIK